ncbi:MAG: ABC transporter substrate-binding protein, partial [Gammaproteobacteria bacterium]|nr:ABC transporter substrate-binding protein [Gammaproteobacteria bacterium]
MLRINKTQMGLAAALAATLAWNAPAVAATPKDTLIMARDIGDIITFDPAEAFEFTTGELLTNIYDRLLMHEPDNLQELVGGVAESWEISDGGKTITFKIRPGLTFHSGNPVTADDVTFSLRRVVKLNKTPVFILSQFGWNADNVDDLVHTVDGRTRITVTEDLSPGLVLNALSATVGSVLDEKLVREHEQDGDLGYEWLKSNSAASGPYRLITWKANELVTLEAFPDYRHGAPATRRVIMRHVAESSAQRLLLEKGDID